MVEQKEKRTITPTKVIITLIIAVLLGFVLNKITEKCEVGNLENGQCVTEEGIVNAVGWFEGSKFWTRVAWVLGVLTFMYVIYIYSNRKTATVEKLQLRKHTPNKAKKAMEKHFLNILKIPHENTKQGMKCEEGTFQWYKKGNPFTKPNREVFWEGQAQINNTPHQGIYSVRVSLNEELKDIEEGQFGWEKTLLEHFDMDELAKPIFQPLTPQERIAERLIQQGNVEALAEAQARAAEADIERFAKTTDDVKQTQVIVPQQQQPIQYAPKYVRPRRRTTYRRGLPY